MINFHVPIVVLPKGNYKMPRVVRGKIKGMLDNPKVKANAAELVLACRPFAPKVPFTGPVAVRYMFVFPFRKADRKSQKRLKLSYMDWLKKPHYYNGTKPDLGQLEKQMDDVLEKAGFVENDSRIAVRMDMHGKYWGHDADVGAYVWVEEIGGQW